MSGRCSFRILFFGILSLIVTACGAQTPSGSLAIIDQVNIYLSEGDCSDALTTLSPLYNSSSTDNSVRMAMAEVYACEAGFNFFTFISGAESTSFSNTGALFEFFAKEFPSSGSTISDKVVESAGYGIDALMSILIPSNVLISGDLFNTSTYNEASLLYTDRTTASNEYLLFLSMVAMGGLENRVGATATGAPSDSALPLSWITASATGMATATGLNASGCEYASALLNFADSLASISANCPANPPVTNVPCYLAYTLNEVAAVADSASSTNGTAETFTQAIYDACNYGCKNTLPGAADTVLFNTQGGWTKSGCTVTNLPSCDQCPLLLRNRGNCTGVTTDDVSCAAAGIINFVNNSLIGWK
jgi:hypothetical protein